VNRTTEAFRRLLVKHPWVKQQGLLQTFYFPTSDQRYWARSRVSSLRSSIGRESTMRIQRQI
jgi:hypothetical protein